MEQRAGTYIECHSGQQLHRGGRTDRAASGKIVICGAFISWIQPSLLF